MIASGEQLLASAHMILEDYSQLWTLCESCKDMLGSSQMVIAERALDNCIEPWESFSQGEWSRGRCFGEQGELQWRSYGPLVRAAIVLEVVDECSGSAIEAQMTALGFDEVTLEQLWATTEQLALQTNDGEYDEAKLRSYSREDDIAQFVRYCRVGKSVEQEER